MAIHRWKGLFGVIFAMLCFFGMENAIAAPQVIIGTGATAAENIFFRIKEPIEKTGEVKLVIIVGGPVQAIKDLEIGMVEAAVGGVAFADWMSMVDKAGYTIPDKKAYKSQVIGNDIIQVITNKDVKVADLTKEQLAGIFSGKIKNWAEVGGPDISIVAFLNTNSPGTTFVFKKQILNGEAYGPEVIELSSASALKARVRGTPGAIALATQGQIDDTINVPAIPKVERPITLITKGAPSGGLNKVLEYISGPGKQYIAK
jgi:phosphate transport system substrate-binding protein